MTALEQIVHGRLLAAAVIDEPNHAVPLAKALHRGGLRVMEVTFRNTHAADCIRRIANEAPEMIIGAGTLLTPGQIDQARAAGATFGVSPGFNPTTIRYAQSINFPFIPGVATAGEIEQALELGCTIMKLFPAAPLGGPAFIQAIAGPFAHTPLKLVPLGGISEANLNQYLSLPLVAAVGGSWLTERSLQAAGAWDEIENRTRRAIEIASKAKPQS